MADLSSYTPIYIRTTGDDATGDGSLSAPFATAQKGFDTAIATASGNYVLDFGAGNFGGVVLSQDWPARIAVRGTGATQSFLGGVNGDGQDTVFVNPNNPGEGVVSYLQPGRAISIISDKTVNIGNVTSNGGAEFPYYGWLPFDGRPGGAISLTNCIGGDIQSNGNGLFSDNVAQGGDIALINSECGSVTCVGGGNNYENSTYNRGGHVTLLNSTCGDINNTGGDGEGYPPGGDVTATNSTCGNITSNGGGFWNTGGTGGTVTLTNSTCGDINSNGKDSGGDFGGPGGDGGVVLLTGSSSGSISVNGGSGLYSSGGPGNGGSVVVTSSTCGNISLVGGTDDTPGAPGTATFAGTSFNDDTVTGNAVFNGQSFNIGTVTGVITYNGFTGTNQYGRFVLGQLARTLYFNAAADNDWATLGNWWLDSEFTTPAASLPTSADDVFMTGGCYYNNGDDPTVANLTVTGMEFGGRNITVTGLATFNGDGVYCNIVGNCVFNSGNFDSAWSPGYTITGNATFNGGSVCNGLVTGIVKLNTTGYGELPTGGLLRFFGGATIPSVFCANNLVGSDNLPIVTLEFNDSTQVFNVGDYACNYVCIFNDGSSNAAIISAPATFNDSGTNTGTINGNATFNDSSYNYGAAYGAATFNDSSYNSGTVTGNATFNNVSYNFFGVVYGNATFNNNSFNITGGVGGFAVFNDDSSCNDIYGADLTQPSNLVVFNGNSYNASFASPPAGATFNGSSYNYGWVNGDTTFNDSSYNYNSSGYDIATVNGNATFNGNSFNLGTVTGTITYNGFTGTNQYGTFLRGGIPRTLYFNAAVDNDWATLGNWWTDDGYTQQAPSLPASIDDVVNASGQGIDTNNSGSDPAVENLTLRDFIDWENGGSAASSISIAITVTGVATISDLSGVFGTITGTAVFNDYAICFGFINGDATFNDSASVQQDMMFYSGIVYGNATFNDNAFCQYASVIGNVVCNGNSYIAGFIGGNATFNGSSGIQEGATMFNTCVATFNDTSYLGGLATSAGPTTFNGNSVNSGGTVTGTVTFNDYSYNYYGYVIGAATFNDSSYNGGTCNGAATFNDSAYNGYNGNGVVSGDATFNDNSYNAYAVTGNATFNDSAYNDIFATVYSDAAFNDNSINHGAVNNATFNDASFAYALATYNGSVIIGTRTPYPIPRGVNGSSILGVV